MPRSCSASSLLFLALLNCFALFTLPDVTIATAAASITGDDYAPTPQQNYHQHVTQSSKSRNTLPQLTWLRDVAVEMVFGPSPKSSLPRTTKPSRPQATSRLPTTLSAQYGGDVVLRFNISTAEEEGAFAEVADTLLLDIWEFNHNWVDVRLREDDIPLILDLLPKSLHTAYSNLMPDLAQRIYQTYPSITFSERELRDTRDQDALFTPRLRAARDSVDNIFFQDYQPLSVIVPWMKLMASMFTTHVQLINIGISYEGRDIPALRIGVHPTNDQEDTGKRPTILIVGGSHAREWISVSSVTYIAWSLITSYGKSPSITKLLQEFDWVFVPTLNPDGYVFTWENDRLWRKNRQQTSLRFCRGLDLDRAFDFEWDGTSYQSNPCSESYPGDEPFQAVESHRLAVWTKNETENNNVKFVGFLDLHSYSQQVLYPYSYSCKASPPSQENLEELGMGLAKAIRLSSGEYYDVQSACEGAVPFASKTPAQKKSDVKTRTETGGGSAIDWFYHEMGVRYSYQIKLRDTGSYGFLLPSENIIPTGEEAFNALKYFGDFLLGNKGIETGRHMAEDEEIVDEGLSLGKDFEGEKDWPLSDKEVTIADADEATDIYIDDDDEMTRFWEMRRKLRR